MSDGLEPSTTLAQRPLELVVGVAMVGVLGLDRLADRRPHQVKVPISRAGGIEPATGVEVLLENGHDLVLAETKPLLSDGVQMKWRAQSLARVEIPDAGDDLFDFRLVAAGVIVRHHGRASTTHRISRALRRPRAVILPTRHLPLATQMVESTLGTH